MAEELFERQLALEYEMITAGEATYRHRAKDAEDKGLLSMTRHGSAVVRRSLGLVVTHLESWLSECEAKKIGRRVRAAQYIKAVGAEKAAYIGIKMVIDRCGSAGKANVTLVSLADAVGKGLANEAELQIFLAENPEEFKKARRYCDLSDRRNQTYLNKVMLRFARRDIEPTDWPTTDRIKVGTQIIMSIAEATGIIEVVKVNEKKRTVYYVLPTEDAVRWIAGMASEYSMASPVLSPMLHPPRPWTSNRDGGYLTNFPGKPTMLKTGERMAIRELERHKPTAVFEAVNRIQAAGRRINRQVLEIMREAFDQGLEAGRHFPSTTPTPKTLKPAILREGERRMAEWKASGDTEAMEAWREKHREVIHEYRRAEYYRHRDEAPRVSRVLQVQGALRVAVKFANEPAIYFPGCLDFRGRYYSIPSGLNPQGPDPQRALLEFSEGLPLTEANRGLFWLKVSGANHWGEDKCDYRDRVDWVDTQLDRIKAVAADPLGTHQWWTQADKPWQFLAFCLELSAALDHGEGFVSHLPVSLDGSCNGLQHYAAVLRDPHLAGLVNVLPGDRPADIYGTVWEGVKARMQAALFRDAPWKCPEKPLEVHDREGWFKRWLSLPIAGRKIAKRSTMTLPYAATMFSSRRFVTEAIEEGGRKLRDHFTPGDDRDVAYEAGAFVYQELWAEIKVVAQTAFEAMGFIQGCAKVALRSGEPFLWVTPDGFPVVQRYVSTEAVEVRTCVMGKTYYLTAQRPTIEMDKREMVSAVAPNFIHSLDGAALRLFVNAAATRGVHSVTVVHDDYGALAAQVETVHEVIRETFAELHETRNHLEDFKDALSECLEPEDEDDMPATPTLGALDFSQVRESLFIFN